MTRDALLQQAWGYDYMGESRTVDVHVAALREKLKGAAVQIQSVRGRRLQARAQEGPGRAGIAGAS